MAALTTAQALIIQALKRINVVDMGETPTTQELGDRFIDLNVMLDGWAEDSVLSLAQTTIVWPLVAGQGSYTIGPTGQIVTTGVPFDLISATYADSNNDVLPLDVITREEYYQIPDRLQTQSMPELLFFDPGGTQQSSQVGTVFAFPIPDGSNTYTVSGQFTMPFSEFASLSASYNFPPSYQWAILTNFALEMCDVYGKQAGPNLMRISSKSYNTLQRTNSKVIRSEMDFGQKGGFNVISGDFV